MELRPGKEVGAALNSFKTPQRIALIGGASEIGNAVLRSLPQDGIEEVIRFDRQTSGFDAAIESVRREVVSSMFTKDLDVAIIAIGALGNQESTTEEANLLRVIEVNYLSTAHLLYLIASKMVTQGHGKILVISSFAQERPRIDNFAYGSTKAAIDFYARGLSHKLKNSGVEIKILRPGFVLTRMTQGMKPAPFSISAEQAGKIGAKLLQGRSTIAYAPTILRYVAIIFRNLPEIIFRRLG